MLFDARLRETAGMGCREFAWLWVGCLLLGLVMDVAFAEHRYGSAFMFGYMLARYIKS